MASLIDKMGDQALVSLRLRIELLGPFRIACAGREIDLQSRKARSIIGCLAMADDWKLPRERIYGLLWSEADGERAKASLRTAIYELRGVLEAAVPGAFTADKHMLLFDRSKVEVDLSEALDGAKRGVPTTPLLERERVTESILADCEGVDPSFRDWLTAKRQSLHSRLIASLEDSLRRYPIGASDPQIEPLGRAIMRLDPTHEEAARALIRARAAAGDLGAAFGIAKALWELLDTEFEIKPSKETQALIGELRLAQPEDSPYDPLVQGTLSSPGFAETKILPPVPPRKLIINIGGFDAAGVKLDNRYLISGFRQELAACLVRFREWSVRDQAAMPAGTIRAETQDGEYTVDASAFETSEGVRLVLMLRDAASNDYVWSERLQLTLPNWSDAQQTIVRRLATALNVHLSEGRLAVLASMPRADPSAFDMWLQGQTLILRHTPNDWQAGVELVQETIRRLPTYSPAYSALANAYNSKHIAFPGLLPDSERTAEALKFAQEAVRLDPVNSRAQLCLAWSYAMSRQPDDAATHAELARELNDTDAWTNVSAIACLRVAGHHTDALRLTQTTPLEHARAGPLGWAYLSFIRFLEGDLDGCILAGQKGGQSYVLLPAYVAAAHALLGQAELARQEADRFKLALERRWFGEHEASPEAISRWVMTSFPLQDDDDQERWYAGLRKAGIVID